MQANRPEALVLPSCSCQISNQILDLGWVGQFQRQWTLTNGPAPATRFFRLLLEPHLTRGRALVFIGEPLDFAAMRALTGDITTNTPMIYRPPREVWLDHLGNYDEQGRLTNSNQGALDGKYGKITSRTFHNIFLDLFPFPSITSPSNDFRVDYSGAANGLPRESIIWSSEAQIYHDLTEFRTRYFNDEFIDSLGLPAQTVQNLKHLQYRPDLMMSEPTEFHKPEIQIQESVDVEGGIRLHPERNFMESVARSRVAGVPEVAGLGPLSLFYDRGVMVGDYAGLMIFWLLGSNRGFPSDAFFNSGQGWKSNVLPAVNDGISAWTAFWLTGDPEVYRYADYAYRVGDRRPCGGTGVPCDKGRKLRNVMMYDEAVGPNGVFPFQGPADLNSSDGPLSADWACLYVAAIFYDIAFEAGLGFDKANRLFWKSISLINDSTNLPMKDFGGKILESARFFWPDPRPGRAGKSYYEEDIADVLNSRGLPTGAATDFRTQLPPAIGHTRASTCASKTARAARSSTTGRCSCPCSRRRFSTLRFR